MTEVSFSSTTCAWSPTLGCLINSQVAYDLRDLGVQVFFTDARGTVDLPDDLAQLALRDRSIQQLELRVAAIESTLRAHMERSAAYGREAS